MSHIRHAHTCVQARMYDALLTGAAGATPQEQQLLRAVRTTAAGWRLRKRFDTPAAAEAYRKATAFEALVRGWWVGGFKQQAAFQQPVVVVEVVTLHPNAVTVALQNMGVQYCSAVNCHIDLCVCMCCAAPCVCLL